MAAEVRVKVTLDSLGRVVRVATTELQPQINPWYKLANPRKHLSYLSILCGDQLCTASSFLVFLRV